MLVGADQGACAFVLATADQAGNCDCSFSGGFTAVKVLDENSLVFPDYPGNGAFQRLRNILENPNIEMLFIDFTNQQRLRINGRAVLLDDTDLCLVSRMHSSSQINR